MNCRTLARCLAFSRSVCRQCLIFSARALAFLFVGLLGALPTRVFASDEGGFDFTRPVVTRPAAKSEQSPSPNASVPVESLPRSVAILPFENATTDSDIAEEVRRAFYNQFSSKPYGDIELAAVDARLLALERGDKASVAKDKDRLRNFCQSLGCDGVISGRVIEFRKIFAGV